MFQLIETLIVQVHFHLKYIEEWKKFLDDKNVTGAVLIDLSKAFDCIPYDLLVVKRHAYGHSMDAITFIYSYIKRRKQGVKINDTQSLFKMKVCLVCFIRSISQIHPRSDIVQHIF